MTGRPHGVRARVHRLRVIAGVVAVLAAAAACSPVKDPPLRSRVLVYGDSFMVESFDHLALRTGSQGVEAIRRQFPGIAICDVIPALASDVASYRPSVAVLSFAGLDVTDCMRQRPGTTLDKYIEDAETATRILREHGVAVLWVGVPLRIGEPWGRWWTSNVFADTAARWGPPVFYVDDPARSVFSDALGYFPLQMPCLAHESPALGCSGGQIQVRSSVNGQHFCPDGSFPCGVYAAGGYRFGTATADIAVALI